MAYPLIFDISTPYGPFPLWVQGDSEIVVKSSAITSFLGISPEKFQKQVGLHASLLNHESVVKATNILVVFEKVKKTDCKLGWERRYDYLATELYNRIYDLQFSERKPWEMGETKGSDLTAEMRVELYAKLPINTTYMDGENKATMSGPALHAFLKVKTPYRIWIEGRIYDNSEVGLFQPGVDFQKDGDQLYGTITTKFGKHLAMQDMGPVGAQVREYFLEREQECFAYRGQEPMGVVSGDLSALTMLVTQQTNELRVLKNLHQSQEEKLDKILTLLQSNPITFKVTPTSKPEPKVLTEVPTNLEAYTLRQAADILGMSKAYRTKSNPKGKVSLTSWLEREGMIVRTANGHWKPTPNNRKYFIQKSSTSLLLTKQLIDEVACVLNDDVAVSV